MTLCICGNWFRIIWYEFSSIFGFSKCTMIADIFVDEVLSNPIWKIDGVVSSIHETKKN